MRLVVPGTEDRVESVGSHGLIYHIRAPFAPWQSEYRILYPERFLRPDGPILRILRDERPDVVEICDKYTLQYLGGLLRERMIPNLDYRPTLIGLSCERMDENLAAYLSRGRLGAWFARFYMKWLYFPMFDQHIVNSHHTAGELAEAARGHKVRRGVWLGWMGVDVDAFSPERRSVEKRQALASRAGQPAGSTLLLYAGRLAREKNLMLLVDTLERLEQQRPGEFRLLIAGSGEMRQPLETAVRERAPGRAAFLGHIGEKEELADLYANADVFVHPNPQEPFGIAPLEAMASGLPLVAPNSGGLLTYACEDNAWLSEPCAERFAAAIAEVRGNPAERNRKAAAGLETAVQFGWAAAADRFLDLYRDLHELTQGLRTTPGIEPVFFSTPGDHWGREVGVIGTWRPSQLGGRGPATTR